MPQTEALKDSKHIVVELPMTVEEARQIIWQGRGPREPIGGLLDSKLLDRGDLAWASDKAYDPQVKKAALTLLADLLGKPATLEATQRYGPEVIEGSHYLEDKELESALSMGTVVGVAAYGVVVFALQGVFVLLQMGFGLVFFAGLLVWLISLGLVAYLGRRSFMTHKNFRKGRAGEDTIVERLRAALDHRWAIFRNLHLPDRKDDLDIVLERVPS